MKTRKIVTAAAYLIGTRDSILDEHYNDCAELLNELRNDDDAGRIRNLCMIRNEIMKDYMYFAERIDMLTYGLGYGLDKLERTKDSALWLREHGTEVCLYGKKTNDLQIHLNDLIAQNINSVRRYFGDNINFEYIRELFVIPWYKKVENLKKEAWKYRNNDNHFLYPFGQYIHWKPTESGLILDNDLHFLNVVYSQHNDRYNTPWNYTDADDAVTDRIRCFLENAEGATQMYVDSENVDLYQLVAMLEALDKKLLSGIRKIVVIRDQHNHSGWDMVNSKLGISVEHHHAVRVLEGKSSVDPELMLDVSNDYHTNGVRNIILISSDVDFSALVRKIDANYMVFYQRNKVSDDTLRFYSDNNVSTVALNSFAAHRSESFKREVFRKELDRHLKEQLPKNGFEIAGMISQNTAMHLSETELKNFFKRYIKGIILRFRDNGDLAIEIPNG